MSGGDTVRVPFILLAVLLAVIVGGLAVGCIWHTPR
jgi:hypothetical protein